jgi:hypothetical protein
VACHVGEEERERERDEERKKGEIKRERREKENRDRDRKERPSCHVGHTGTHLIIKVKQRWARLVLTGVNAKIKSMLDAVRRCSHILCPGKASEKTPREVIPPVCVKYRLKKNK